MNKEAFAMKSIATAGIATVTPSSRINFAPNIKRIAATSVI
jgi:hypothetical protein